MILAVYGGLNLYYKDESPRIRDGHWNFLMEED